MKKVFVFLSCLGLLSCAKNEAPITCHWEFGRNDVEPRVAEAYLTITNISGKELDSDWTLYFCMEAMAPVCREGDEICGTQIQGSYHCYRPSDTYRPIPADSSRTYCLRFRGNGIRENKHPEGLFIVTGKHPEPVTVTCTHDKYTRREQMFRAIETWEKTPYADGEYSYQYNADRAAKQRIETEFPFFPQPKKVEWGETSCSIEDAVCQVTMNDNIVREGYSIRFTPDTVFIEAADEAGVYYAKQTLRKMNATTKVSRIEDFPDLHHRGVMLDIVRNFYPADSVMRVLDIMAECKLNTLHFHISDDEAWRVEIPGLPQRTEQGARRGYTLTETECLYPMYGGGWDYTDPKNTANGFLTRADYIRILQYAKERHIRVIPEIDMPGHMRACKKALYPLLSDSQMDQRAYNGAQEYTDNVIAVTNPYALTFIETVVSELKKMYEEADAEFTIFNIGGDEVPEGSLTHDEHQAFINGVLDILRRYNLQPMGWEEITEFCRPESGAICYSWHNGMEKPQQMADSGYQVVLATANHLYFDFAYCRHHEEKGLDWGGFTDEYRAFDWIPLEHNNVIGMNAQLWAEPIRSFQQVEWQLYPKMFGLAERSWNNHSALSLPEFTSLVYHYMLPLLHAEGHNFHLQLPGIHIEDNMVSMNAVIDAQTPDNYIEYTLDGGTTWQIYTEPFALDKNILPVVTDDYGTARVIKARWHYLDHLSNTTWLWIE